MTTIRSSSVFLSGLVVAFIIIAPLVALAAWSEPTQAPTGGNPDAPINTGTQNQNKNGGLSVTGFAVFGSTALNGNTYLKTGVTGSIYRYLNFGADYDVNGDVIASTIGESGYGIREKDGTLEFKNFGGDWQSIQAILWDLCGGPCGGGGGGGGTPVVFSVNKGGTPQSVSAGVDTKLTWSTETFDTNNNFANNRFTPTVPGKYFVHAQIEGNVQTSTDVLSIYKNDVPIASSRTLGSASFGHGTNISDIVDMNGTTDYIEVHFVSGQTRPCGRI